MVLGRVLFQAGRVDRMPTVENDYGDGRSKHILRAYRTSHLQTVFYTFMGVPQVHVQTHVAFHAVEVVDLQALSDTAEIAVGTMVNRFAGIVVQELAYIAVVVGKGFVAFWIRTGGCYWLYRLAMHT